MRCRRVKNISNHDVTAELDEGTKLIIPPNIEAKNIRVQNLSDIHKDCEVVSDLGEIRESKPGKTKLLG